MSGSRIFHIFSTSGSFQAKGTTPHNQQCGPIVISTYRPSALFQSGQTGVGTEEVSDVMATENKKVEMQGCQDVAMSSSITNFFEPGINSNRNLKNDFHFR